MIWTVCFVANDRNIIQDKSPPCNVLAYSSTFTTPKWSSSNGLLSKCQTTSISLFVCFFIKHVGSHLSDQDGFPTNRNCHWRWSGNGSCTKPNSDHGKLGVFLNPIFWTLLLTILSNLKCIAVNQIYCCNFCRCYRFR